MRPSLRQPAPGTPQPRFCPLCGTRVKETATKCLVCGTDLNRPRRTGPPRRYFPNPLALALLAAFILIGLGLLGLATGAVPLPAFLIPDTPTITLTFTPLPSSTPTPTASATPLPTATLPPPIDYKVKDGDSCLAIAINYDVTVESIILQNSLDPACTIAVGHVIKIPRPTPAPTPRPTATAKGATAGPAPTVGTPIPQATYVVVEGDTCLAIAYQYHLTVDELMTLNGLGNCQFLRIGQVLIVPAQPPAAALSATPTP